MISILTIGLIPISSALDFDLNHHASNSELALSDSIERDQKVSFEESVLAGCQYFLACVAHYGCAPLPSSSLLTVIARVAAHRTVSIWNASVSTRYLSIPELPPKT